MSPKKTYSIKKEDLEKNEKERFMSRKEFSFLVFDFGEQLAHETYVTMSLADFKKLYETYKEISEEGY